MKIHNYMKPNMQIRMGSMTGREYRNYIWKIRRKREVQKRICMMVLTICLIAGAVFSYRSFVSLAKTESGTEPLFFKYYTKIEVAYGDSLWSIASDYADQHYKNLPEYIEEVKSINRLRGDVIKEGQTLIVPYYSDEFK